MHSLLIVDDEQLERQAIRYIIKKYCPDIEIIGEAGDGESAVLHAGQQQPDIIVMDIRMPEMTGLEATKRIKAISPECRIIILTAFDEFSYARQAIKLGATEYLLKPVRPKELAKVLHRAVVQLQEIEQKKLEEAHLRKCLDEAMPFIQMSFVHDLVSGSINDLELIRERAAFLGLKTDPGAAMVVAIDKLNHLIRHESELKKQVLKQSIYQSACASAGDNALLTPFGGDKIIAILGKPLGLSPDELKKAVRRIAENIQRESVRNTGVEVTVGIGRFYDDSREVYKSYVEALNAYQQSFFFGGNQLLFFEDLPQSKIGFFVYPFLNERAMLDQVRCGNRKASKESLQKLLAEIFVGSSNIETVKACVLELMIVLSRAAVEGGASLEQLTLMNLSLINELMACQTQEQVFDWLMVILDGYLDNMIENRTTVNIRVINRACSYIATNCDHPLSLEEVAQTVHLSPFYFSRVFKQEKGCTFVDFLTKVRIERAKKLLRNAEYNVVQVALRSGYKDSSYFCKVFRQEVGITPNQFRSRLRGIEGANERDS